MVSKRETWSYFGYSIYCHFFWKPPSWHHPDVFQNAGAQHSNLLNGTCCLWKGTEWEVAVILNAESCKPKHSSQGTYWRLWLDLRLANTSRFMSVAKFRESGLAPCNGHFMLNTCLFQGMSKEMCFKTPWGEESQNRCRYGDRSSSHEAADRPKHGGHRR